MIKRKKSTLSIAISLLFLIFFWWLILIIKIVKNKKKEKNKTETNQYNKKSIMSDCEKYFFDILTKNFSNEYLVLPQINLSTIINKNKDFPRQYQNELNRNIDFGIFDKNSMSPLLLIEINDKTHEQKERIARDIKVKEICKIAKINLITFYTKYKNKPKYIIDKINNELKKD